MSAQGPIIVVSSGGSVPFAASLGDMFPIIETDWAEASRAVEQVQPAAVLVATPEDSQDALQALAIQIAAQQLYIPLIVIDPKTSLPINAIPFSQSDDSVDRLSARLSAALRIRTLHSTVLRRMAGDPVMQRLFDRDSILEATVLLIGRGAT